jgi:hypothetical protein
MDAVSDVQGSETRDSFSLIVFLTIARAAYAWDGLHSCALQVVAALISAGRLLFAAFFQEFAYCVMRYLSG